MSNENTRVVEVIRVGSIDLDKNYPSKTAVRLIDRSAIYDDKPPLFLRSALAYARRSIYEGVPTKTDKALAPGASTIRVVNLYFASQVGMFLANSVGDLYNKLKGTRLAGVNVDVWDQIAGAYLGPRNTDKNGTLILPTDAQFVEVLQWKLNGGGYSEAFNGERAAGTPGLLFYFPCNEGSGSTVAGFPEVCGQQVSWGGNWYEQGFFARPALKVASSASLQTRGAEPEGRRGFQFLWYCGSDPSSATYQIFGYSSLGLGLATDFGLWVNRGNLEGRVPTATGTATQTGTTTLQAGEWYLIQVNTILFARWNPTSSAMEYTLQLDVYIGGTLELTVNSGGFVPSTNVQLNNLAYFGGIADDGLDELRHLPRELYSAEIAAYSLFIKGGRVETKSKGSLGTPGW